MENLHGEIKKILTIFEPGDCEAERIFYEPIYESIPTELTQHWILNDMGISRFTLMGGKLERKIDLMAILRSSNQNNLSREETLLVTTLSETLTFIRRQITENPLKSSVNTFFLYLSLIKKINQYFHNNSVPLDNFVATSERLENVDSCSLFLYEYMNALIFTTQRIYHSVKSSNYDLGLGNGSKEMMESLLQCQSLFEELKTVMLDFLQNAASQRATSKWKCRISPASISNSDNYQKKIQDLQEQERELLSIYSKEYLCGVDTVETRIKLFHIKFNEMKIGMMIGATSDIAVEEKKQILYTIIAPVIRSISIDYDTITTKHATSNSYILVYSQFMSYYWFLFGEYQLAAIDWECFQLEYYEEIDLVGKRALKRLENLIISLEKRDVNITKNTLFPLDYSLTKIYQELKTSIEILEKTVRSKVLIACAYKSSAVSLGEIKPQQLSTSNHCNITNLLDKQWKDFLSSQQSVSDAFLLLEKLSTQILSPKESHSIIVVEKEVEEDGNVNEENEIHLTDRITKDSFLEERSDWFKWLLSLKDKRGEIFFSERKVRELEKEFLQVQEVIKKNNSSSS